MTFCGRAGEVSLFANIVCHNSVFIKSGMYKRGLTEFGHMQFIKEAPNTSPAKEILFHMNLAPAP